MILNWQDYLSTHKDKMEYEKNADQIQSIIDNKVQAPANFLDLCDHPTLAVLTRSLAGKEVQVSFYHAVKKNKLLTKTHDRFALVGFGRRACAMKIDPKEMFKQSSKNKKIPSFNRIMKCDSTGDIESLIPTQVMVEEKLESHSILPPSLLDCLYEQESFHAADILLTFVNCIKKLKLMMNIQSAGEGCSTSSEPSICTTKELENEWNDLSDSEIGNARAEAPKQNRTVTRTRAKDKEANGDLPIVSQEKHQKEDEVDTPQEALTKDSTEAEEFDSDDRFFEKRYGSTLRFLWSVIHEESSVKPTRLTPCCKKSTMDWADSVHAACLDQATPLPPQFTPPPGPAPMRMELGGFDNAAIAMAKLSDAWERKIEMEVQEKETRDQKKQEKSFDKLADVQKRTFILITAKETDDDERVPDMKPTKDALKLLEQTVGLKAQAHLQHEFNKHGHICDVGLAMSTQIKNGCLMSMPSVNDINGVSPFFLPDQASDERLSHELALRLEEQLVLGKINDSDLKTITKCKIHFPKNFGEYVHFIRNFRRMIIILAGESSIFAKKLSSLLSHAQEHERSYKELEKEYFFFYASILETIHRRCQQFIHSTSLGLVSKLKLKKLEFGELLEEIEDGDYVPTKPKWLQNKKRESPSHDNHPRQSAASSGHHREGNNHQPQKKKSIDNPNFDPDLKIPADLRYRQVFHPANRRGIDEVKHTDGSVRCNNWFFRGWCTDACKFHESHSKKLSSAEKTKCKEYMDKLVERQKKWNDQQNHRRNNHGHEGQ